jgi:protein TonB
MFEYSLVPEGKASPLPIAAACVSEAMLIAGLIIVPLLFVQTLPDRSLYSALMLAPVPVAPPSPPPPMLAAKPLHRAVPVRMFNPEALVSPVAVPKVVAIIDEAPAAPAYAVVGGVPGGIPGIAGNGGTGFFSNSVGVAPPPPPPLPKTVATAPPPPPAAIRQVTVGGDVEEAMLLQKTPPAYPQLARQGRIHGSVVLKAIIGTDGRIKNLTAISGHPLLVDAAMSAVRYWLYKPTVLDGAPVEVNTEIVVRFQLTT